MYLNSQDGVSTSFDNEIVLWLPGNGHDTNTTCVGTDTTSIPMRYVKFWVLIEFIFGYYKLRIKDEV